MTASGEFHDVPGREQVVERMASFDFLSQEYRDLVGRANATAFQTPLWMDRLYARLAPATGAQPAIITVREGPGRRLVAVLPFAIRSYYGMRVAEFADFGVCDYCAPVAEAGIEDGAGPEIEPEIGKEVARLFADCDLILVRKVPEAARRGFSMMGPLVWSQMAIRAHKAELTAPYGAWREAALSPSRRKFLDIKRRKLHRQGRVEVKCPQDPGEIAGAIAAIRAFRAYRFSETGLKDLLGEDAYALFYREAAFEAPPVRVYVVTAGGMPVSVAFGLVHKGAFSLLLSGFDFERLRNFSLGLLLIEDIAADLIARGEPMLDLTIGDQPYKLEFGTRPTTMWAAWRGLSVKGRLLAWGLARLPWAPALARRLMRRQGTTATQPS